jgi:hypothetical protein
MTDIKAMNAYIIITDAEDGTKKFEVSLTPVENSTKVTILPNHSAQYLEKGGVLNSDDILTIISNMKDKEDYHVSLIYLTQSMILRKLRLL